MITLVIGGARSGKSAIAEDLARRTGVPVTYFATSRVEPDDESMVSRVVAHRHRRPDDWITVEVAGDDVAALLDQASGMVLIDSLTAWVAGAPGFAVNVTLLCAALGGTKADVVVVTDEVGFGVSPSTVTGNEFRDALGLVNAAVADVADEALLVIAGRVLRLDRWAPRT
jgi:adenosyl cobinamide kinase/adenosyl cobinamide phosphate guanylyltransferase